MRLGAFVGMFVLSIVPAASAEDQIPKEIVEYYDDWNLVICFSDRTEREILAVCEHWEMVPGLMKNGRIHAVYLAMGRVAESTGNTDARTKPSKGPENQPIISSNELILPERAVTSGDGMNVEVGILPVDIEQQYYFQIHGEHMQDPVSEYKNKVFKDHPERRVIRRETHHWILAQGRWKKRDENTIPPPR